MGEEARTVASSLAAKRRLEYLADDAFGLAQANALEHVAAHPEVELDNPAAYGTTIIRNALKHLLSADRPLLPGADGDRVTFEPIDGVEPVDPVDPVDPEAATPVSDDARVDEIRAVAEALGGHGWLVSSVLTFLTLGFDGVEPPAGLPVPQSGATPRQARCWPALALAGETDLFPDGGDDPSARRKRRSRRIREVLDRVEAAWARVMGQTPAHRPGGDHDG